MDVGNQYIESVPMRIMGITVNEEFIFFKPDIIEFITVPAILCSGLMLTKVWIEKLNLLKFVIPGYTLKCQDRYGCYLADQADNTIQLPYVHLAQNVIYFLTGQELG
jgi:hypothetical protein